MAETKKKPYTIDDLIETLTAIREKTGSNIPIRFTADSGNYRDQSFHSNRMSWFDITWEALDGQTKEERLHMPGYSGAILKIELE